MSEAEDSVEIVVALCAPIAWPAGLPEWLGNELLDLEQVAELRHCSLPDPVPELAERLHGQLLELCDLLEPPTSLKGFTRCLVGIHATLARLDLALDIILGLDHEAGGPTPEPA